MYESFYGFSSRPFTLVPDPRFLYPARHHAAAAAMLDYGLAQQSGFVLLTGEVGSGKTMLIRDLMARLDESTTVGLISNTHHAFGRLLQWVSLAFGLPYKDRESAELYDALTEFLIREYERGRRVLLIVDEAQNLSPHALEELRVLSNLNADQHFVLQMVLVGQPELRETLQRADLRQLAQRIAVEYHVGALEREEARSYVRHRLAVAGGHPDLIEPDAIDLAHVRTGGVPRLLNSLCDLALVYAFADQRPSVDIGLMSDAARDRAQGGLFPSPTAGPRAQNRP